MSKTTPAAELDSAALARFVDGFWQSDILPTLTRYIEIPALSPLFDPDWAANGHLDRAVELCEAWAREHAPAGTTIEVVRLEGRSPVLFLEVPGVGEEPVLLYGHLDKQPEMTGWRADLGPWKPVLEGDRLYGRGGADDGYALFASLAALRALADQGVSHAPCAVLIEACEESGSYDLPHYIEALSERIGRASLVVCLDSGAGNFEQMWCTTSLRGCIAGDLTVELLGEGVHSGDASGIVPDGFRVLRSLLSRIEDEATGAVLADFHVEIPTERADQARFAAESLGDTVWRRFPWVGEAGPVPGEVAELILNRTWRPALSITGAAGLPALVDAGNVSRPLTAAKLSLRIPPGLDGQAATARLTELLTDNPPYGARVAFTPEKSATGWQAPSLAPWLEAAAKRASKAHFGRPAAYMGEGGSIPFMNLLSEKFPEAQFLITGVLGPGANAHGPNEFLHIPCARHLTACVAEVLVDHARR